MRWYFRLVTSWPKVVLTAAGASVLVLGVFIPGLTREADPDAFIPPDHPALALKQRVDELFDLRETLAIGVIRDAPDGIFNPDTLRLIQSLTEAVRPLSGIGPGCVVSIATESNVYFEDGEPGFDLLLRDIPEDREGLDSLKQDILGYELYRGTLVAEDGSAACILLKPDSDQQTDTLYRRLSRLLQDPAITSQCKAGEQLVVAGEAAVRAHMGVAVSDDALRMNFVCPVVMVVLIMFAYRTVRGTVLPLCVIGGSSAWALGLMAALGVPIYIVTNGIFVIIMALGVADSLHLLGQYYEEQLHPTSRTRQDIVIDACMALWYPLLITTLTDVVGFFALFLVGEMPPIRFFGLFTCVGVLGALAFSYTVVPAGLMIVPLHMSGAFCRAGGTEGEAARPNLAGVVLGRLGRAVFHRRWVVLGVGTVLMVVAVWGASKMRVNDARILAFKDRHPIVQATRELNERFDGTSRLNIVVSGSRKGAMIQPDVLRKIEALEAFTESLPYVGGTHSLAGWVKRAHQKMNEEDPAYYAIPGDAAETKYYLDVLGDHRTSPMAHLLREVVDPDYTRTNLTVRMKSSQFIHQREVLRRLERFLSEEFNDEFIQAEPAGRVHLDYHWLRLVRTTHIKSVCLSVGCVLLLTGLMFRSLVAGLFCTLTVGSAVLVNYAIMGLADIPLGVGTSMFAAIAVGAGVNAPIHILDRLRLGLRRCDSAPPDVFADTLVHTGRVLFFTALVVAVGFFLLCVSEFRTLIHFGLLIGVSMIVSFLSSVTLLPAAVAALRPRFIQRDLAKGGGQQPPCTGEYRSAAR